jgi:hypothetical protein
MREAVIVLTAELLQFAYQAGIFPALYVNQGVEMKMRAVGLYRPPGMDDTQRGRALKPTRKFRVVEEVKNGFQGVPLMFENDLTGRTAALLPPPLNEG